MKEAVRLAELHLKEVQVASELETSATTTRAARHILEIPEIVKDVTIVDLAAGACPLTADLLDRGANAYAVDHLYGEQGKLAAAAARSLELVIQNARRVQPEYATRMYELTEAAILDFWKSFNTHPDRYKEGWLTQLPFEDNISDMTLSLNGISELWGDQEVMQRALDEALRITKPGGKITIAPFLTAKGITVPMHRTLFKSLLLSHIGRVTIIRNIPGYNDSRLEIIKS
ncbi:class I SAM-dependent methyltransferase [Candidatus Microgenomates bacterium]|nr:class I SAM-dependent methyltransferase [Candidatus Microgenomates bacterium]